MKHTKMLGAFLTVCGFLSAQTPTGPNAALQADSPPVFRVTAVARTAKAINYRHRGGSTTIDFAGTSLMPKSRGEAKVESKQGYIEIEVEFDDLQPAVKNGAEYLTYVLWAISPEGRTSNLGEVLLNGTKSKLNVTTEMQVFGLVVTAEPYFSVTRPSDLVVMENVVRKDTRGKVEEIDAKYELLQRGEYKRLTNPLELKLDKKTPLELYEARNAVQIARASGADRYASETFQKAENSLQQAEAYQARKAGKKPVTMTARQAVQTAEDARAIAVQRQEEEALANERQRAAERELRAENERAAAQAETERVTRNAETARLSAENQANLLKQDNEARTAAAQVEADRLKRENETRRAAAEAEADRLRRENNARAEAARIDADNLQRQYDAERAAAQADRDRASKERMRAESERMRAEAERAELRSRLLRQFSEILETRDSARGLIVNMSDVLFDTARYTLRPAAREKLAKVADVTFVPPNSKTYIIRQSSGSGLGKRLVRRMLKGEAEVFKDYGANDLSPANYEFRFLGNETIGGHRCYKLALLPKRKQDTLLHGHVWVDVDTHLPHRIEGEPAKRPSWWLRDVRIVLFYSDFGGMWLQTASEFTTNVKLFGQHTMTSRDVKYEPVKLASEAVLEPGPLLQANKDQKPSCSAPCAPDLPEGLAGQRSDSQETHSGFRIAAKDLFSGQCSGTAETIAV